MQRHSAFCKEKLDVDFLQKVNAFFQKVNAKFSKVVLLFFGSKMTYLEKAISRRVSRHTNPISLPKKVK